ncbi:MAG TPA: retropepsin-like aspartic protease, partial [Chthoniobacterales bacterium]|nr:retropepsin-like aspartic protease [Chthoniobacterales bacterium]
VSVSLAKVASLAVGSAKLEDMDVGLVDLSHIGKTIGARIDGDLGYNFLKHFRITLDYRNNEMRLDDPRRFELAGPSLAVTEVAMRLASPAKPLILVDVYANGRGPFQFAIDTGTSTTAITPELAKQLGVASSPIGPATTGGAQVDVTAGVLPSFQVGGARIDHLAVIVADFFAMLSKAAGAQLDGIVGYNFLRHYKVALDYPNETLSLFTP